jgi:hypothetical protein
VRIAVYSIAKNEEQFIERWAASAAEADLVVLADTGSTDQTVDIAMGLGVAVHSITVSPWRFDDARNAALSMISPAIDLCIALDADEVLQPGWRDHLESLDPVVTRPRYKYVWSWNEDGSEGLSYSGDKIHSRSGYRWKHPVHEVLTPSLGLQEVHGWCGLEIHHHPDHTKSRGQYGPLLEWAVQEDPYDDRNAYYLGREYSYKQDWEKAKPELLRYLDLPGATWPPERSAAKRLLAKCEPERAEFWLLSAAAEAPGRREPWVDLAEHYHDTLRWADCYSSALRALGITEKPLEYICEDRAWGALPHDLAGISAYHLGLPSCLDHGATAVLIEPSNDRLIENYAFYVQRFGMDDAKETV